MLNVTDLDEFLRLVRLVEREEWAHRGAHPDTVLLSTERSDQLLNQNELSRLRSSLRIAWFAGYASESSPQILDVIVRELSAKERRYLPLSHSDEWLSAIRWAAPRACPSVAESHLPRGMDRQFHVGSACRRLHNRGYCVQFGAFGPRLDDETRATIAQRVDSLIKQIGGIAALQEICGLMGATGKVHDGMWILGQRPGSPDRTAGPAIPIGWLLSLALRHIHTTSSKIEPTDDWKLAVELAIDFAASMDCQRYNQYDGFNLGATDFLQSLEESLTWRELFTLPQVPPLALPTIRRAFSQITWPDGTDDLRRDVDDLFAESDRLVAALSVDRLPKIPAQAVRFAFPHLWRLARAPQGAVNAEYLDPFGAHSSNHNQFVFFESDDDQILLLPPALTAAAACVAIFTSVRTRAGKPKADKIVGDTMEKAVAIACRSRAGCVQERLIYREGKTRLDIDVAVREGAELVLFEAKSKSLTAKARTGDMMAFLFDYANGFVFPLRQLVRHERNIKRGLTPLTGPEDDIDTSRITKVAVSPLCYGPSSDHVRAGSLFRAIVQARLRSVSGDSRHLTILDAFNKELDRITHYLEDIASTEDGQFHLIRYSINLFWLDLGQLLYALHRGRSVVHALSALRSITYGTLDYWNEAAFADREGLTKHNWHPISPADGPVSASGRRRNCR